MKWICYTLSLLWWITSQFTSSQVPNAKCLTSIDSFWDPHFFLCWKNVTRNARSNLSQVRLIKNPEKKNKVSCHGPDDFWGEKNVVNNHKPSPLPHWRFMIGTWKRPRRDPQRQITPTPRCSMKTIGFSPTNWVFRWISEFPQENPSDENGELNVEIGATEWAEPGNSRLRRQRPDGLGPENG